MGIKCNDGFSSAEKIIVRGSFAEGPLPMVRKWPFERQESRRVSKVQVH